MEVLLVVLSGASEESTGRLEGRLRTGLREEEEEE